MLIDLQISSTKPTWARLREQLPEPPANAFVNRDAFIHGIIQWRQARSKKSNRDLPIYEVIRGNDNVFPGVGVYTSSEILFIAGASSFITSTFVFLSQSHAQIKLVLGDLASLTEAEVFDCPSRAARLIEGYLSYVIRAHEEILWVV